VARGYSGGLRQDFSVRSSTLNFLQLQNQISAVKILIDFVSSEAWFSAPNAALTVRRMRKESESAVLKVTTTSSSVPAAIHVKHRHKAPEATHLWMLDDGTYLTHTHNSTFVITDDSVENFVADQDAVLVGRRRRIPQHENALWWHRHCIHVLRRLTWY